MYHEQLARHAFSQTNSPVGFIPLSPPTLATKGYNTEEAHKLDKIFDTDKKINYLRRNLETTVNHLYQDSVVSFTNHYQLDRRGEIITYPDGVSLHLDPEERGKLIYARPHFCCCRRNRKPKQDSNLLQSPWPHCV